jgi:hypothetical protein
MTYLKGRSLTAAAKADPPSPSRATTRQARTDAGQADLARRIAKLRKIAQDANAMADELVHQLEDDLRQPTERVK